MIHNYIHNLRLKFKFKPVNVKRSFLVTHFYLQSLHCIALHCLEDENKREHFLHACHMLVFVWKNNMKQNKNQDPILKIA